MAKQKDCLKKQKDGYRQRMEIYNDVKLKQKKRGDKHNTKTNNVLFFAGICLSSAVEIEFPCE